MKKVVKMPIKFLKKRAPFIVWFQQKTTQKELINMKTTNNFLLNLQVKLWQKTEKVAKDLSIKEKKFTRDMIQGIIKSRSCILRQIAQSQKEDISLEDIIDLIRCRPDEEKLNWNTDQFWHTYEAIKSFRVLHTNPTSEQSVEMKALNNLNYLIQNLKPLIMPYSGFLRTLREDIQSYGTLPDYTLRRIMNFKEDRPEEIKELMSEIGENYLIRELERLKDNPQEIIISIENRKL